MRTMFTSVLGSTFLNIYLQQVTYGTRPGSPSYFLSGGPRCRNEISYNSHELDQLQALNLPWPDLWTEGYGV